MKKSHMKGVFDPISIAFLLAIVGTVASLTIETDTSKQAQSQSSAEVVESVALSQPQ